MAKEYDKEESIISSQSPGSLSKNEAIQSLVSFEVNWSDAVKIITGIALTIAQPREELIPDGIKTVSRLIQSAIRGRFLNEIRDGVQTLIERGDVLEDAEGNLPQEVVDSMTELIDFIDSEKTNDAARLRAIQLLFLTSIKKSISEGDRLLAQELLILATKLRSG